MINNNNNKETHRKETKTYITGEILPLFRGKLHFVVTFLILIIILVIVCIKKINKKYYLVIFLVGKLLSYSISSYLHNGSINNLRLYNSVLKIDKLVIFLSIYLTGIPFLNNSSENYHNINIILIVLGTYFLIYNYNIPYLFFLIFQFFYSSFFVGYIVKYNILWIVANVCFILAFFVYLPCSKKKSDEDVCWPLCWHKKGIYGCHEDFHLLIFISDTLYFILAILFLHQQN